MRPIIFDYPNFSTYLGEYVGFRKRGERAFSYRNLSRRMGGTSPSLIAMVANGQRSASATFLHRFAQAAKLPKLEVEYAETLIGLERASTERQKAVYMERLRELRPGAESVTIRLDQFEFIARWHHVALLEMVSLEDFVEDEAWLARRLGGKITGKEAGYALERLKRLGFLTVDAAGKLRKSSVAFKSPSGIPNVAIRTFHKDMLGLAADALEAQPVEERYVSGQTMTIKHSKLPEARRIVEECLEKMRALVPDEDGDETYHFAVQLFKLTQESDEKAKAKVAEAAKKAAVRPRRGTITVR